MKNSKREIALTGGLGNQLFQFAAALSLFNQERFAIDCNLGLPRTNKRNMPELESFYIDASVEWVQQPNSNLYKRLYGLGIRLATRNGNSCLDRFKLCSYKLILLVAKFFLGNSSSSPIIISRGVGFDKALPSNLNSGYLIGYFQTFRYLENPRVKEILMTLRPKEISEEFKKIDVEMKVSRNTIIHIRLGDYRNELKIGMIKGEYYSSALRTALDEIQDSAIWLFSDEPTEAIKLINRDLRSRIRLIVEDLSTSETFELMRNGNFYIISNSTFSWWAASLSRRFPVKILAPQPWFLGQDSPIELIPSQWISLNRQQ